MKNNATLVNILENMPQIRKLQKFQADVKCESKCESQVLVHASGVLNTSKY